MTSILGRTRFERQACSGLPVGSLLILLLGVAAFGSLQAQSQASLQSLLAANQNSMPCTPLLLAQLWSPGDQGLERVVAKGRQRDCDAPAQAALAQPAAAVLPDSAPAGELDWILAVDAALIADGRAWHRSTSWRHDGTVWQPDGDLLRAITPWEYQQFQQSLDELLAEEQ